MFKKKQSAPKRPDSGSEPRRKSPMPGMFGIYDMSDDVMGDGGDNDPDLEAELNQLLGGGGGRKKGASPKPKKQLMDWSDLDAQISASMKDDDNDDDEDLEDGGDLEAELFGLVGDDEDSLAPPEPNRRRSPSPQPQAASGSPQQILEERKKNYEAAIQNAQAKGESSKVRRYKRGMDTINTLMKKAKAGKPINEEEIPPQVATGKSTEPAPQEPTPVPVRPDPPTISVSSPPKSAEPPPIRRSAPPPPPQQEPKAASTEPKVDAKIVEMLTKRQTEFKMAAVNAKKAGNKEEALKYFKILKQFDVVIAAANEGKPVDLSQMPKPPGQSAAQPEAKPVQPPPAAPSKPGPPAPSEPTPAAAEPPAPKGIPTPKTMLEGLTQRREKYQSTADQAKKDGNGSKSRRMARIVKQYDDAIRMCKAGKPCNVAELPVPMGYPPLPGTNEKQQDISDVIQQAVKLEHDESPMEEPPIAQAALAAAAAQPAARPRPSPSNLPAPKQPARSPSPKRPASSQQKHSAYDQQIEFLQNRQAAFKEAALAAKKKGDKEKAMELLKKMKGFQPMIEQAKNGLKVDITKVPMPPMIRDEDPSVPSDVAFEILDGGKCHEDDTEIYKTLMDTLHDQVKKARAYSDQFTHSGDINGANMFDNLARESQRDHDFVKNLKRHGDPPPRYFFDNKTFESVNIIPELNSTDLELVIVQLLDIDAKDAKPFVEWEMPFPHDSPIKGKTEEAKGVGNFKYDAHFKVPIVRKNKGFQRAIKNKAIKLEVMQRGGFLRSDKSLGSTSVKLGPLETSCEIRAVESLKDGRAVVGRIEVKVRMRTPLISSESKTTTEKWMIVSHEHAHRRPAAQSLQKAPAPSSKPRQQASQRQDYKHPKIQGSVEVLALERRMVEAKIKDLQSKGQRPPASVLQNQQSVQSKLNITQKFLREGGMASRKLYVQFLNAEKANLTKEAQNFVKQGRQDQAKFCLTKRKMIENELQKMAPSNTYL